ncbi:hypothetical protein [Streptomyces sp. NPDC048639]|uniref:hypothetical protein n=1 Tax=Streptomyces sp. NPDC048639 TaxID=3365581 RepID=UPI0037219179
MVTETGDGSAEPETPEPQPKGPGGHQTRVQFGYACSPAGALGTAEDGRPAKCFMGKDGRARWGYDSDRG